MIVLLYLPVKYRLADEPCQPVLLAEPSATAHGAKTKPHPGTHLRPLLMEEQLLKGLIQRGKYHIRQNAVDLVDNNLRFVPGILRRVSPGDYQIRELLLQRLPELLQIVCCLCQKETALVLLHHRIDEQLPQLPVIRLLQPLFSGDACRRENVTVRHHMNVHGFQTFPVLRILARIHKHLLRHKAHRIENVIVQIFFYHTGCILHGIILQFHAQNADFLRHIHHLQFCFSITMICFFVQTYLSH